MIDKEYVEYFMEYFEEVGIVKLGNHVLMSPSVELDNNFTFPDGTEFPIAQLIIEACKGERDDS